MDLIANQSRGLQTAWLLSTLGSKASSRGKIIRKDDLLKILIPKLCTELIEYHRDRVGVNIRFSSNVLHGISILYGSKIAQVLSEVTHVQLRLQNTYIHLSTGSSEQFWKQDKVHTLKRSEFLENDQAFQVECDFMPRLQISGLGLDELPDVKRRKLEIAEYDLREFSIFDTTSGADASTITGLDHFALAIDQQTDANFDNIDFSIHDNELGAPEDNEHVNLQFNEDGEILEIQEQEIVRSSLDIEIEHSRRCDDSLQMSDELDVAQDLQPQEDLNSTIHELTIENAEDHERLGEAPHPLTSSSFRIPKRKLVIDDTTNLTRDFIINHHDNYATIMNYRSSNISTGRKLQQVYQHLNSTRFRPWASGSSSRHLNSSSIEETINRTMGIFHRTEIMANEASEQARNSQVLMEIERSRVLPSDDLSQDLEDLGQRDLEDLNFDAAMLDLDFDLERSRDEEDDGDEDELFHQSSSLGVSSDGDDLQPHLIPRLKKLVKYFIQRLVELGKASDSQEKEYYLNFKELVPVRYNNEVNTKKIAAGAFSSILFLANKSLVSIDADRQGIEDITLSSSSDINLTLHKLE